jgi:hypothetical protein
MKTFEFSIARDGETFAEDFAAENRDVAELDIVVRINEVWHTDYATFDDLTADSDGFDLIEHPAVMAQRIPLATMTLYRRLADGLSNMVEERAVLTESTIPDDYQWLVETLAAIAGEDPGDTELPPHMRGGTPNACRHCADDLGGFHQPGGPCVHCNGIN